MAVRIVEHSAERAALVVEPPLAPLTAERSAPLVAPLAERPAPPSALPSVPLAPLTAPLVAERSTPRIAPLLAGGRRRL